MIKDLLGDIFSPYSTFGERCTALFILLIILVLIGLLALGTFALIDSFGITATKTTTTVIEGKEIVPAHTTTTFVLSGKIMIPITTFYPERCELRFQINGQEVKSAVEKEFFASLNTGEKIEVDYGFGRLSESYKPVTVRVAKE